MTVREKLIAIAETQAERDLLNMWMDEDPWEQCARQRAWERVNMRRQRNDLRCSW